MLLLQVQLLFGNLEFENKKTTKMINKGYSQYEIIRLESIFFVENRKE